MAGCTYCKQVKQLMDLTEQRYVVYTLGEDFSIEEFQEKFNTKYFPQVVLDDKLIGGAKETVAYFRESNLV